MARSIGKFSVANSANILPALLAGSLAIGYEILAGDLGRSCRLPSSFSAMQLLADSLDHSDSRRVSQRGLGCHGSPILRHSVIQKGPVSISSEKNTLTPPTASETPARSHRTFTAIEGTGGSGRFPRISLNSYLNSNNAAGN